jgi:chemotaxis protein MotB
MKADRPQKSDGAPVIRVIKKKSHGGHHGGSWKVAYADFVTAMMAFFLVMWIIGQDDSVKEMIEAYFNNPIAFNKAVAAGHNPLPGGGPSLATMARPPELDAMRDAEERHFEEIRDRIRAKLDETDGLQELRAQVEILITDDGLRIELIEAGSGETFFALGSAELKPAARRALELIGPELGRVTNNVVLEGHTDAAPFRMPRASYTNWELSVDRANAARRTLIERGVTDRRVVEIRGYADRQLRLPGEPLDPANRRISILLPFRGGEDGLLNQFETAGARAAAAPGAGAQGPVPLPVRLPARPVTSAETPRAVGLGN